MPGSPAKVLAVNTGLSKPHPSTGLPGRSLILVRIGLNPPLSQPKRLGEAKLKVGGAHTRRQARRATLIPHPTMVKVFILLGGLIGVDGYAVSPGILMLAHRLKAFGAVTTYNWTAREKVARRIDLLIAYDPSPAWSMSSLGRNVDKAICYCNSSPLMLGLGGAQLRGQAVETVPISEQHLAVQFDQSLHKRTIAEIEKLAKADPPNSERSDKR